MVSNLKTSKKLKHMNKRFSILTILIAAFAFIQVPAMAQMTDEAVYTYVKEGVENGKSQDMLIKELLAKGVTKEQALRIKSNLEGKGTTGAIREAGVQERMRRTKVRQNHRIPTVRD